MIDLLIRNGTIFDPGQKLNQTGDIAVHRGVIIAVGQNLEYKAERELNAKGFYVVPGLIDVHTHINWKGNYIGMPADLGCIPNGVTATIDAGSTGVSNYRALVQYMDTCEVKTKMMLHASASGQIMSKQFAENIDPDVWNLDLFERAFEELKGRVIGLKLRVSRNVVKEMGLYPLEKAVQLAEHLGTRVLIHPTDPPVSMEELSRYLRKDDVMCHMYHGEGHTILEKGKISEELWKSRERGVIYDVSQGKGNFSIKLAGEAIRQGFLPDTISTDLNIENWNDPWDFSLLMTMSKLMALGMSFEQVIYTTTAAAAKMFGEPGKLGILKEETPADITILQIADQKIVFRDKYDDTVEGHQILKPIETIIDGNLRYCSSDMLTER